MFGTKSREFTVGGNRPKINFIPIYNKMNLRKESSMRDLHTNPLSTFTALFSTRTRISFKTEILIKICYHLYIARSTPLLF